MEKNNSNNVKSDSLLPFDMQIANEIIKKHNIWLVKDLETGKRIPYFYCQNRYVEDCFGDVIRGFIKDELLEIFSFYFDPDSFSGMPERRNELLKYNVSEADFEKYENSPGYLNVLTKNILKDILDLSELIREEADFDFDATLVNTQNGILDLESGKLFAHTPDKLIRNIVNANFVVSCNSIEINRIEGENNKELSLFFQLISSALLDDTKSEEENKEVVRSFIEVLASCLIGNNEHKFVFIIIGAPNTGKSTLLEVLLGIFGEYGTTFNNSALLYSPRTANDIRPDIIALKGKRLLAGSEANKSQKFDNALVKQISGNDKISVRKPHKGNMITFTISGKILLVTNYCPMFTDLDDKAFLNRIVLVDFNNVPQDFDTTLREKLLTKDSRDAIFSYLANIACEIVIKKEIFIHERFKANKQRILINQNSTVSLFWKNHIRPYDNYKMPITLMRHHPINLLYKVMYIDFCNNHKPRLDPLPYEAFAKEFKAITDETPIPTWKKGKSNNYYIGFEVEGGEEKYYYSLLNNEYFDKTKISFEGLFE